MKFNFVLLTALLSLGTVQNVASLDAVDTSTTSTKIGLQYQSQNSKILVAGGQKFSERHETKDVLEVELIDLCSNEPAIL